LEQANAADNLTMLWYSGRNFPAQRSIVQKMTDDIADLLTLDKSSEGDLLEQLNKLPQIKDRRVLVFFDALNENSNPGDVLNAIDELVRRAENYPWLKVIITSRPQAWRTIRSSRTDKMVERFYYTHPGSIAPMLELEGFQSLESEDKDGGIEIPQFKRQDELQNVYELYRKEYSIQTTFDQIEFGMAELLRDPFALQMIARIFQGRALPTSVNPIDLVEMLVSRLREEENRPNRQLETPYLEQADMDFLDELLPLFFDVNVPRNSIPRRALENDNPDFLGHSLHDRVMNDTRLTSGQTVNAAYQHLESAGILTIEGTRAEYFLRFRFERFYDYFIGTSLYQQIENRSVQEKCEEYANLIHLMIDYPFLWGPIHRAILMELAKPTAQELVMELAPLTEQETLTAPLMQDLLVEVLIDYGSKNLALIEAICEALLYSEYDSWYEKLRRHSHAYRWAIAVAVPLKLTEVLKKASDHHDEYIKNAVAYATYLSYRDDPELSMSVIKHVISRVWPGVLINFSALYTALALSLLIWMNYYSAKNADKRTADLVQAWQPVVRRLGGGKGRRILGRILKPIVRLILRLVVRVVIYRLGHVAVAEHGGVLTVPDLEASIPFPDEAKPHLDVMLQHYLYAYNNIDLKIEDLAPHCHAVMFHENPNIRNNILVCLLPFAAMLPWIRRDPVANSKLVRELFEEAKLRRSDLMEKASPLINSLIMSSASSSTPQSPEGVDLIMENYGVLVYEFEEFWRSRSYGLKSEYLGDETFNYASNYFKHYGSLESPYLIDYFKLLVTRRELAKIKRGIVSLGAGGLVDMDNNPVKSTYVLLHVLSENLNALRQIEDVKYEDFSDAIVGAFTNLRQLDPIGTISLLEEQKDDLVTDLMKHRILAARRSPKIGQILGTVVSWFASMATYAEDPTGREVFEHFLRQLIYSKSVTDALINFINSYLEGSANR
jgi:hypothetical protein